MWSIIDMSAWLASALPGDEQMNAVLKMLSSQKCGTCTIISKDTMNNVSFIEPRAPKDTSLAADWATLVK